MWARYPFSFLVDSNKHIPPKQKEFQNKKNVGNSKTSILVVFFLKKNVAVYIRALPTFEKQTKRGLFILAVPVVLSTASSIRFAALMRYLANPTKTVHMMHSKYSFFICKKIAKVLDDLLPGCQLKLRPVARPPLGPAGEGPPRVVPPGARRESSRGCSWLGGAAWVPASARGVNEPHAWSRDRV
jgi:hypothetical protein